MSPTSKARKLETSELTTLTRAARRFVFIGLTYWLLAIPVLVLLPFPTVILLSKLFNISSTFLITVLALFIIAIWFLGIVVAFWRGLKHITRAGKLLLIIRDQTDIPIHVGKISKKDRIIQERHPLKISYFFNANGQGKIEAELWIHNNDVYTIHYISEITQDTIIKPEASSSQPYKDLLFADQDLEPLLFTSNFPDDDTLRKAIQHFKKGSFFEGYSVLRMTGDRTRAEPFRVLAIAFAQFRLGLFENAKQVLLQAALVPEFNSRIHLLTWTALRNRGVYPKAPFAEQVLGTILEIPESRGIDTLAAYTDGRVGHINQEGRIAAWESTQGKISEMAKHVIETAQNLVHDFPVEQDRHPLKEDNIRITLLTCGGVRVQEEKKKHIETKDSKLFSVFMAGDELLSALTELVQKP